MEAYGVHQSVSARESVLCIHSQLWRYFHRSNKQIVFTYPTKSECLVWLAQACCSAVKTEGPLNSMPPSQRGFPSPPYLILKSFPHPHSHGALKSPSELLKNLELQLSRVYLATRRAQTPFSETPQVEIHCLMPFMCYIRWQHLEPSNTCHCWWPETASI